MNFFFLSFSNAEILWPLPQNQTSNLPISPPELRANLLPVIYYFSPGTSSLPVCARVFTVRVACLVGLSWRNVCSPNGVNK